MDVAQKQREAEQGELHRDKVEDDCQVPDHRLAFLISWMIEAAAAQTMPMTEKMSEGVSSPITPAMPASKIDETANAIHMSVMTTPRALRSKVNRWRWGPGRK